jgi:hypothetical protein
MVLLLRHTNKCDVLVIRKRIATDPSSKVRRVVRVLANGTEIEDPVVVSVTMLEELACILAPVAIQALDACRRVAHDNNVVSDVREICFGRVRCEQ